MTFNLFSKTSKLFFFFSFSLSLFLTYTPLHPPTSSYHTEPSIYLSCCPSWWLWEWLCWWWWWLLFLEIHKHFVTLFQVFVHWTRLVSLPHVVGVIIMVLPSLLNPVQPGVVLLLAWNQLQGLFWLICLWFVSFLFCSFFLIIVVVFSSFFILRNFNSRELAVLGKDVFSNLTNLQELFILLPLLLTLFTPFRHFGVLNATVLF